MTMKAALRLALAVLAAAGCVTIDRNSLLVKGTPVVLEDATTDPILSASVGLDRAAIVRRLFESTRKELAEHGIRTVPEKTAGSAALRYDIRTVSQIKLTKVQLRYTVKLVTTDGRTVFDDSDEKEDDDIDQVCDKIASRVARSISRSFER